MLDQIGSRQSAAFPAKRVISAGYCKEPYVHDGPVEILVRHDIRNAEVGSMLGKYVGGRKQGVLKELQANMRIQLGEFRQGRKEPFIRIDAVHGEADLTLAP
jgi:hypothetical protein